MARTLVILNEEGTRNTGEILVKHIPRIGETICMIARPDPNGWSGKTFKVVNVTHEILYPVTKSITVLIDRI